MKLVGVQMLRGIAVLLVLQHHATEVMVSYGGMGGPLAHWLLNNVGAAGVDMFFVISGFIMCYSVGWRTSTGPAAAGAFLWKRAARIYPPYLVWTALCLILWSAGILWRSKTWSTEYIAASLVLLPAFEGGKAVHPIIDQGWSLTYEMYFYLITAASLLIRGNRTFAVLGAFVGVAAVAALVLPAQVARYLPISPFILEFLAGWGVCLVYRWGHIPAKLEFPAVPVLLGCIGVLAIGGAYGHEDPLSRVVGWGGAGSLAIVLALTVKGANGFIGRLLSVLGNASYSIYLTHGFVIVAMGALLKSGKLAMLPPAVLGTVSMPLMCLLGWLAYRFVEKPLSVDNIRGLFRRTAAA